MQGWKLKQSLKGRKEIVEWEVAFSENNMHIIKYPEKGRFSSEGIVTAWDKNEGDPAKKGDLLVQIEAAGEWIQIESAADGALLKILAEAGRIVRSGDPLAVIGKAGEDVSKAMRQLEHNKPAPPQRTPQTFAEAQNQTRC